MVPISPFLPESSSRGAHHVKAAVGDNDRIALEEGGDGEPRKAESPSADDNGIYRLIINWKMMRKPTHRRRYRSAKMERKLWFIGED